MKNPLCVERTANCNETNLCVGHYRNEHRKNWSDKSCLHWRYFSFILSATATYVTRRIQYWIEKWQVLSSSTRKILQITTLQSWNDFWGNMASNTYDWSNVKWIMGELDYFNELGIIIYKDNEIELTWDND